MTEYDLVQAIGEHQHPSHNDHIEVRKFMTKLSEKCLTDSSRPRTMIADALSTLGESSLSQLPTVENLGRNITRTRNRNNICHRFQLLELVL